jgi:hypothetical protein
MQSRKRKLIQNTNLIVEERYLKNKFLFEEESEDLPELQVTPEGLGKTKIKFTWKSKGVTLPQDVRDSKLFNNPELGNKFEPLKRIYVDNDEAVKVVSDFLNSKQSLFKSL